MVIALSGVEMADVNEHPMFRYRMSAVTVAIIGSLLVDCLLARRRARRAADAAPTPSPSPSHPDLERGYAAEFMAFVFIAGGAAALWHDHITHDIPNPVAVVGKFFGARCIDRTYKLNGQSIGPHMTMAYEFPSQSTRASMSQTKCLLDSCEPVKAPLLWLPCAAAAVVLLISGFLRISRLRSSS